MSERSPAFQWYPKDYESDEHVKLMTLEQEGAYVRLLNHAWLEGSIPTDVPALARICRVPTAKMARLWSGIKPCWKDAGDGRLVNGRQERDRVKQAAFREERSESGRRGNEAKRTLSARLATPLADAERTHARGTPSVLHTPSPSATNGERALVVSSSENPPNGNGVPDDQRPAYADAVWSEFLRISEQPVTRLMSPGEYATVKVWMDGGVPLRIVLRGMADTKGKGRTLSYFGPSVQEALEYSRQAVPL